jgi:hypothetical protein
MEPSFNAMITPFSAPPEPAPAPPEPAPPPPVAPPPAPEPADVIPAEAPKVVRQRAEKERPIPELKPLVPLPEEWLRSLAEADPKTLQPLEPAAPVIDANVGLVVACILIGGVLGFLCYKSRASVLVEVLEAA